MRPSRGLPRRIRPARTTSCTEQRQITSPNHGWAGLRGVERWRLRELFPKSLVRPARLLPRLLHRERFVQRGRQRCLQPLRAARECPGRLGGDVLHDLAPQPEGSREIGQGERRAGHGALKRRSCRWLDRSASCAGGCLLTPYWTRPPHLQVLRRLEVREACGDRVRTGVRAGLCFAGTPEAPMRRAAVAPLPGRVVVSIAVVPWFMGFPARSGERRGVLAHEALGWGCCHHTRSPAFDGSRQDRRLATPMHFYKEARVDRRTPRRAARAARVSRSERVDLSDRPGRRRCARWKRIFDPGSGRPPRGSSRGDRPVQRPPII